MKYTAKNFRYTEQGWVADVMCDNASLPISMKLDEVNARDCHNFQQAYITASCLPYGPHFGYQMDVKEPETVTDLTRAAYGLGRENLGTRMIISGGDVVELDNHLEASYEERTEEDMPF